MRYFLIWARKTNRSVVMIAALSLVSVLVALPPEGANATETADGSIARPMRWMPALMDAEMGYRDWGNVAYWFSWNIADAPASTDSYAGDGESLEIGFKDIGFAACRTTQAINGSAGFPSEVYRGVDFTEDSGDAVLFVGDMDIMRADILANPGRLYGAWWTCQHGADEFSPGPTSAFYAELGNEDTPLPSFSIAQQVMVPHENVARSFPPHRAANTSSYTRILAPWTIYGNFERSDALTDGHWGVYDAIAARVTGGANQGTGFIRLSPTVGAPDPRLQQYTQVKNQVAPVHPNPFQRMDVGVNTGFQYEGAFRCRPALNGEACQVNVRLYGWPISQPLDRRSIDFSIPNDDRWYYVMYDAWGAGGATPNYFLEIRSLNGATLDIDSQYVSSGY